MKTNLLKMDFAKEVHDLTLRVFGRVVGHAIIMAGNTFGVMKVADLLDDALSRYVHTFVVHDVGVALALVLLALDARRLLREARRS